MLTRHDYALACGWGSTLPARGDLMARLSTGWRCGCARMRAFGTAAIVRGSSEAMREALRGVKRIPWTVCLFLAHFIATSAPAQSVHPVLLVHGLWSDCSTWDGVVGDLESSQFVEAPSLFFWAGRADPTLYRECRATRGGPTIRLDQLQTEGDAYVRATAGLLGKSVVARLTFSSSDGQTFAEQGRQVNAAVRRLREMTGASKVLLVGHSMGGLAARAYVQSPAYRGDVSTIMTIVTPHAGSGLGDIVVSSLPPMCRIGTWLKNMRTDAPAVRYLLPDSRELRQLNDGLGVYGGMPVDVSVWAMVGTFEDRVGSTCAWSYRQVLTRWASRLANQQRVGEIAISSGVVGLHSDGIVSVVSQHPKAATVMGRTQVDVEQIEGFHSDVLSDDAPRASIVARIIALAGVAQPAMPNVPKEFEGRKVDIQGEAEVRRRSVTFELWDNGNLVDGDIVTLVVNGQRVAEHVELSRMHRAIPVELQDGDNVVLLIAENVGTAPPNTAAMSVSDGIVTRDLVLHADLRTSAAYRVVVRP